jgi:hypothetical protein
MTKPVRRTAPETAPEHETPTDTAPEAEGPPESREMPPVTVEEDDGEIEGGPVDTQIVHLRWKTEMGVIRPDFRMRDFDRAEIRGMKQDEINRMADSPFFEVTRAPVE